MKANFNIQAVLDSYLETLLWASGEEGEFDGITIYDFSEEAVNSSKKDIEKFIETINEKPTAVAEANEYDERMFGHNFALSRNGHGAGFFDDNNDRLQYICRETKSAEPYLGDDKKVYIM
jgi:hypothetical protein